MLTIQELQKPISHAARRELAERHAKIFKMQSALETLLDWINGKPPRDSEFLWAKEIIETALEP